MWWYDSRDSLFHSLSILRQGIWKCVWSFVYLNRNSGKKNVRWHWIKAHNKYEMFTAKWNETRECKHEVNNTRCFVYVGAVSTLANDCLWWNGVLGYQFIIMFTISVKVYLHLTDIHPTVNTSRRVASVRCHTVHLMNSLLSKWSFTVNSR